MAASAGTYLVTANMIAALVAVIIWSISFVGMTRYLKSHYGNKQGGHMLISCAARANASGASIEGGPYAMPETRCETMQVADAFRAKRRRAIGTDRIEELVEDGRFSTTSDAVEIALEELVHNIEGIPYAMRETRCEIMQAADAFRAKIRRGLLWKN
jgi:hypothetical protein